jgi:hypothetical protein
MKKHIIFTLGLLALGITQVYSMEQQVMLDKKKQKEFRELLAGYRGAYLQQQLLTLTGRAENKAEARLRKKHEERLSNYKQLHGGDDFVKDHFRKLEKFKTKEVPAIIAEVKQT